MEPNNYNGNEHRQIKKDKQMQAIQQQQLQQHLTVLSGAVGSTTDDTLKFVNETDANVLAMKTPVSMLQEKLSRHGITPGYELVQIEGTIHEPTFRFRVSFKNKDTSFTAMGAGRSKKKAKHAAAHALISKLIGVQLESQGNSAVAAAAVAAVVGSTLPGGNGGDGDGNGNNASAPGSGGDAGDKIVGNPIGWLQEKCMQRRWPPPSYETETEVGLPHERLFTITCTILSYREVGKGKSKKIAKRLAAHKMWTRLQYTPIDAAQINEIRAVQPPVVPTHISRKLLLSTASGDAKMLEDVGAISSAQGRHNIAFLSAFLRSDVDRCLEILIETNRLPEAAFFARTYLPSQMSRIVELWREELGKVNEKAGQSLADPTQYTNLFPGLSDALRVEQHLQEERARKVSARVAGQLVLNSERNPLEELHAAEQQSGVGQQEDKEKPAYVPVSSTKSAAPVAAAAAAVSEEDDDDDDLDLEIDGITLDDNIDTTDVNLDDDFLSDD